MLPSLSPGTVLQNRYCILKILGQGGFGRTYLAKDQERSDEQCVLKEFIPTVNNDQFLQKAKELFLREAHILYQLRHSQIPQFYTTFEEAQRLFLVQEFVEGLTYHKVLQQRLAQGQTFSEAEALHFLQKLLPVVAYIHIKGIIHRDISPENIILRQRDNLPVLIDFGIVKDLASQVQTEEELGHVTSVGKAGYAPREQLQTGKAYPSSDLYALAITTIVLLTGRRSQDLVDETTMAWRWPQWLLHLTPQFIQVLRRMLSANPQNRYQTATEVAQALSAIADTVAASPTSTVTAPPTSDQLSSLTAAYSQVNRPPVSQPVPKSAQQLAEPAIAQPESTSSKPSWLLPVLVGLSVAFPGALMVWKSIPLLARNTPSEKTEALPAYDYDAVRYGSVNEVPEAESISTPRESLPAEQTTVAVTPIPSPPAEPSLPVELEPVSFASGYGRVQMTGQANPAAIKRYLLSAKEGQVIAASLLQGEATLHIRTLEGKSLKQGALSWQSEPLATSRSYHIDVEAPRVTDYILELSINSPNPSLQAVP